jgi:hypothetical protein
MNGMAVLQQGLEWAYELLDTVTADVTHEQAHWLPPGQANPIKALYIHAVLGEDALRGLLSQVTPLYASSWQGKTGVSDPQWQLSLAWARSVQLDLPVFREYAQAVRTATLAFLAPLTDEHLGQELDLTGLGLGSRNLGWALNALLVGHINNMTGEISTLKGLQGTQGYPF